MCATWDIKSRIGVSVSIAGRPVLYTLIVVDGRRQKRLISYRLSIEGSIINMLLQLLSYLSESGHQEEIAGVFKEPDQTMLLAVTLSL